MSSQLFIIILQPSASSSCLLRKPQVTYTLNACIAGGLYVNLAVADVNALLCRDSHFVKGLVYIYGRWFALGFNTHSDSFINKPGEIILTKLIHRLVELV